MQHSFVAHIGVSAPLTGRHWTRHSVTLVMPNDEDQDRRIRAKPASRFATFASVRRNARRGLLD
jgi:hypothetical protein